MNEGSVVLPKYFFCGNRRHQIRHTRLRTNVALQTMTYSLNESVTLPFVGVEPVGFREKLFNIIMILNMYTAQGQGKITLAG